jgi:hypothetical protein
MWPSHAYLILLVTIVLFIAGCSPPATTTPTPYPGATPTTAPTLETITGNFRNQISLLEQNMPRAKSEGYVVPTAQEQADFVRLVSMVNKDEVGHAADLLNKNYYRLNYYVDRGDDYALSYLLREQRPIQKGWGLYAFRANSTSNIIIESPHPLYDRRTPSVALDLYRALDARALLIAGAHRNANGDGSADAAHAQNSIFESVHEALVKEVLATSGQVIILQIHGFHSTKHAGYPQAVFGFGNKIDTSELSLGQELEDTFAEQGLKVGSCDGNLWKDLCGTRNIQAASPGGALFIHMELDEELRKNDQAFVAALVRVFSK